MSLRAVLTRAAVAVAALAVASPASASHGPPPWTGGAAVTSALEARLGAITTELARVPGLGHCPTPEEWEIFADGYGFSAGGTYGFVPGTASGPANYAFYNPVVCSLLDEFLANPQREGQKACQVGTRTEYRTETRTEYRTETRTEYQTKTRTVRYRATVRKRVKVGGKWRWKRVRVWKTRRVTTQVPHEVQVQVPYTVEVQVPVTVPVFDKCRFYDLTVESIETVAHESMHVGGVRSEPAAECFGLQLTTLTGLRLGAAAPFAIEIGRDYLPLYAAFVQASPDYATPDCYDGGPLDLYPATGWPNPAVSARSTLAGVPAPAPLRYSSWIGPHGATVDGRGEPLPPLDQVVR